MDLLAHAAYGATVLSRSGLAGGRKGLPGKRWYQDSSAWWAILFGILPDILSLWPAFIYFWASGIHDNYFYVFDGGWLVLYRYAHSLVMAAIISGLAFCMRRSLFLPSLAMGLHILWDVVSHGTGRWQTMPFYPFSDFGIQGKPFWTNLWFIGIYWSILVAIWIFLAVWRNRRKT